MIANKFIVELDTSKDFKMKYADIGILLQSHREM